MALPAETAASAPGIADLTAEVLDAIEDAFYALDRRWRIVHANGRACTAWGIAREDLIGRLLWDCFPQLAGSDCGRLLRAAGGEGAEFVAPCPVLQRLVRVRVVPLRGGGGAVFWRAARDEDADAEARRSDEERLRIASEMAQLGHWQRDLATGELSSSAQCKANYGLPPDADLTYAAVFAAIDPEHRDAVREASRRAVAERTDYTAEYPIRWPDGSRHWIAVRGKCLYGIDGMPRRTVGITLDITERCRAEEALRASEERLLLAQEGAGVGVWDWDIRADAIWWSPQMFRLLGLDPERDAGDPYASWLRVLHPEDRARAHAHAQRRRSDPEPREFEFRVVQPGGDVRWILAKGIAVTRDEAGRPVRVAGINIDITDRKLAEARLRDLTEDLETAVGNRTRELAEVSERLQRERLLSELIIESAAEGIIVVDSELRIRLWNAAIERINGRPRGTVLGRTLYEAFPHLVGAPVGNAWQSAVAGQRAVMRGQRYVSPTRNVEIVYDADYWPLRDQSGAIVGAVGIVADRTDPTRKLAALNQRLVRERRLSELIVESAAEGIIVVDTGLRHLVWNAAIERINGMPREEVLGRGVFEVFPGFADHPVGHAWRDALAGRRAEMRDYRFFSTLRQSEIVYDADFAPLYDEPGAIIGAVCILRETTERHRIEEMLRQSQKLEAVAQLTGGVAHDFNNLLTAIVGCLDLIALQGASERVSGLAEAALRSAARGTRLTQQLLAFARRQALRPVVANLNALLAEFADLLQRAVGAAIEIVIDGAADLARCEVDPAQFEAAVMNLVINARDAMPGGGRIVLRTCNAAAPGDIDLAPGQYVSFSVEDTGQGMNSEVAARAFEPFYTTKEIGKGSGLGLSMVYGFAKQSGGGVRLETAPGAGAAVTVYLPRAAGRSS